MHEANEKQKTKARTIDKDLLQTILDELQDGLEITLSKEEQDAIKRNVLAEIRPELDEIKASIADHLGICGDKKKKGKK